MFTNNLGINLPLAVWLVHDEYDYINEPNYISATRLMKPLRHIILPARVPKEQREAPDVSQFVAQAFGHSLHDSIEKAWTKGFARNLAKLGYPSSVIDRVRINPTEVEAKQPDIIPVYMEQRAIKSFMGYRIGGKFDLVAEGQVQDYKSTGTFTWVKGTRDDEHILQGSLYRWLNPTIITDDTMVINYIFTDWSKGMTRGNPKYPPFRVMSKQLDLMSIPETENWVKRKLALIEQYKDTPEKDIPRCTDEELWRSEPQFKYYADPAKATLPGARSTKNFDVMSDAKQFMADKGSKGVIKIVPGEVKRCDYCDAYSICTQKDEYIQND